MLEEDELELELGLGSFAILKVFKYRPFNSNVVLITASHTDY